MVPNTTRKVRITIGTTGNTKGGPKRNTIRNHTDTNGHHMDNIGYT